MKTNICSVLVLAAALSVSALTPVSAASAPSNVVPTAYSVGSVNQYGNLITRGTTALTVLRLLGTPHWQPSSDTWVYHGYQADFAPANDQQCDTLVLTVDGGKVTDIKLVNNHAAKLIAAHVQTKSTGLIAAAR